MGVYIYTKLPSEYQEVEYIWTTWTQYIDTWIFPWTNIQVETKITVQSTTQEKTVFWNYKSSSTASYLYYHLTAYSNAWYYWINGSEWHAWSYSPVIWTQYEIVYNNENNQLSVNWTEVWSVSWTQWQSWSTLYISARWTVNDCYWYFNYYYFKVFNKTTWEYERDFVPCYRKSDSVIGLYDLVNNQFYTNSWTGTFTKWNDVNNYYEKELKNAYIGQVYEYSYTFKWKTAAEIWNEFDVLVGGIYTNSNWVTWSSNTECRIKKDIPSLATAKKVIISGTIVWQNLSATAGQIWIWKWSWWGTGIAGYQVYWSSYNGMKANLYYNNTDTSWNSVGNATAQTYKPTLIIDLENKTIVWSMSWFSNSTLSLTDAQVADIKTYEYILCYVSMYTSTISDVSITIE